MKIKNIDEMATRIMKWNTAAGNGFGVTEDRRDEQCRLQFDLLCEEFNELAAAVDENDINEIVDACCDIMVVWLYYSLLRDYPDCINKDGSASVTAYNIEMSRICDSNCVIPMFFEVSDGATRLETDGYCAQLAYLLMQEKLYGGDEDLAYKAMDAVMTTNEAKFMTLERAEQGLHATIDKYEGRYSGIVIVPCDGDSGLYCYRGSNGFGKIIKPHDWVAPVLPKPTCTHW